MMRTTLAILIITGLAASVYLPIDIPYDFNSVARVYPAQQWVLQKKPDGSLESSLHDYATGLMKDYTNFQFDRGDVVHIRFDSGFVSGTAIDSGRVVASVSSNTLFGRLVNLKNQLAIAESKLEIERAGEKPEIIAKAKEELRLAKQERDYAKISFERGEELWNDGLISRIDYEALQTSLRETEIKVGVAKNTIEVVEAGVKPEQIRFTQTQIASLKKEISFFESTGNFYELTSPINGNIRYETDAEGDRLIVEDTSAFILLIPVRLKDRNFVDKQSMIELQLADQDTTIQAELIEVGRKTEELAETVVVLAKARVSGTNLGISPGMPIACKVSCGKVRLKEYLKRSTKVDLK